MTQRTHTWMDRRSRAMGCAIAEKLERHPELLAVARANLAHWMAPHGDAPPRAYLEWQSLLAEKSLSELLDLLRSDSEEACRLRQNSPFAGLLTPQERWRILNEYEALRA